MDTKERILEVSKKLFNEKGYQNVRMRDISSSLGISVGNLTYHFNKKEDILKELMKRAAPLHEYSGEVSLELLNQFIIDLIQSIQDYLFFFTCDELFSLNKTFENSNKEKVELLKIKFSKIIHDLKNNGYFIDSLADCTIEALVEMVMFAHLSWARKVKICGFDSFSVTKFVLYHWYLLEPFFTPKAKSEFEQLHITKDFNEKQILTQ